MPKDGQHTRPISDEERAFLEAHKDDLVPLDKNAAQPFDWSAYLAKVRASRGETS